MMADSGVELPPIIVHRETMRIIDGAHRLHAAQLRGEDTIRVQYFDGSEDDAFVLAVHANVTHGLPLSLSDRKCAAERILRTHPSWSDRAVSSAVGLAATTVATIREQTTDGLVSLNTRVGRDGRIRPVDGAAGRKKAIDFLDRNPKASLREISSFAGISLNTARDVRNRISRGEDPLPPTQRRNEPKFDHARPEPPARYRETIDFPEPNANPVWDALKRDPSLRFNEKGRALLRMIESNIVTAERRNGYVDIVPVHLVDAMADLALHCARTWQRFGEQLKNRNSESA